MTCIRIALLAACAFFVGACASLNTVEKADLAKGHHQSFPASFEAVSSAAMNAMENLQDVQVEKTKELDAGLVILASKSMNMDSWGEFVRVYVERGSGDETTVRVVSSKRSRMQMSGTWQHHFAAAIFAGIERRLPTT